MYIIAQVFGLFAVIVWTLSIQNKEKKKILIYQMIASAFYSLQYLFLGAYSACLADFSTCFRSLIFYNEEKKKGIISNFILIIFTLIIIVIGIFTYTGPLSLLPIIANLIYMYSVWQNNLNFTRYLFIVAGLIWMYYNIQVKAYVNIIGNFLEISSGIISIIRFRRK